MDRILEGLNDAQRDAVSSSASVLQVLAPPGSGKTKTLTARVAYLIAHDGLKPWNIVVCTFTVKAANEMKERIKQFIGDDLCKNLKLGTFHSVALRYLKSYGQHIGLSADFGIADTSDCKAILKRIIKKQGLSIESGPALGRISSRKIGSSPANPSAKNVAQQEFELLYSEYESALAASNLLDYDDILIRCCFLLKSHPQCVANVQAVLIDEFQDTNNTQYDLMGLFAQHKNQITIVGDPDQSIYGFRSAEIKNLGRMISQWPDTLTINLKENYRSSGAILHAAQKIIEQDESRPPKKLQATHTFGLRPILRKVPSSYAEADWLVAEVQRVRALSGNMLQLGDFAILLRSASLSRAIESSLGRTGLPYRMVGGTRFFDRVEVKLIVDYLRVIYQPNNSEAVERIVNVPSRRVGEAAIKNLREEAQGDNCSLWQVIVKAAQGRSTRSKLTEPARNGLSAFVNIVLTGQRKLADWETGEPSLVDLINLIVQKISLQSYLRTKYAEEELEARMANVEELRAQAIAVASTTSIDEPVVDDTAPDVESLEQRDTNAQDILSTFLTNIALAAATEQKAEEGTAENQRITISTIHAAKGLEWPIVFIPACYDGSIPHSRAEDNDEERRLLYVGMTRAKTMLYLSSPIKNTQREDTSMSTFLSEPGLGPYFEEQGPSLRSTDVANISRTLARPCPLATDLIAGKATLERTEDDYWPLNGEEPLEETLKWQRGDAASGMRPATWASASTMITMQQHQHQQESPSDPSVQHRGFTSVAARYDELMEQIQLRKIDKRVEKREQTAAASTTTTASAAPIGRKRQIAGQANIATFFGKRQKSDGDASPHATSHPPRHPVLNDMSTNRQSTPPLPPPLLKAPSKSSTLLTTAPHKPRLVPMKTRPSDRENAATTTTATAPNEYLFLSSSPPREPSPDQSTRPSITIAAPASPPPASPAATATSQFKPASTLHRTSMQTVGAPAAAPVSAQRKTLGVRRSWVGWSARGSRPG